MSITMAVVQVSRHSGQPRQHWQITLQKGVHQINQLLTFLTTHILGFNLTATQHKKEGKVRLSDQRSGETSDHHIRIKRQFCGWHQHGKQNWNVHPTLLDIWGYMKTIKVRLALKFKLLSSNWFIHDLYQWCCDLNRLWFTYVNMWAINVSRSEMCAWHPEDTDRNKNFRHRLYIP